MTAVLVQPMGIRTSEAKDGDQWIWYVHVTFTRSQPPILCVDKRGL